MLNNRFCDVDVAGGVTIALAGERHRRGEQPTPTWLGAIESLGRKRGFIG